MGELIGAVARGVLCLLPMQAQVQDRFHRHKQLWLVALLIPILAIGLVDWLAGPHISLGLFYAIPIVMAGWVLGPWAALYASAAAGMGIYLADLAPQLAAVPLSLTPIWNATVRFAFLIVVGQFSARVRTDRDKLRELLTRETSARRATVEQLRHRDRLATIGQISSGIAHEVGTPLNVIGGRARLILEPDTTLPEAREHATAILLQSQRVATTIRQLLDFARRRGPDRDGTNLRDLTSRVLELLRPLATKRQVELHIDPRSVDASAFIDGMQIEQALSNLVMNAIQAIPEHGSVYVRIGTTLATPPASAAVSARNQELVMLTVEDTGTGIAPENIPHIFEPFFTTQHAGEGTGLGLSITHEIIRDHGGWIEVKSEPWKGSRFTVYLPRAPRPARVSQEGQ